MPFTFSHPAAVLPLCKTRPFVFSAAVAGSMAPDFDSFLHLSTNVTFGHSAPGILRFCLPAGLIVFLLFHGLLKAPLAALLPDDHQRRLRPFLERRFPASVAEWSGVVLALLAGISTHLFWDSLTHRYGWMVLKFPVLASAVGSFGGSPVRAYTLLQHGGGLFGALVLLAAYGLWYRNAPVFDAPPSVLPRNRRYAVLWGIAVAAGATAGIYAGIRARSAFDPVDFARDAVLMGVPAALAGCILFSGHWHLRRVRARLRR